MTQIVRLRHSHQKYIKKKQKNSIFNKLNVESWNQKRKQVYKIIKEEDQYQPRLQSYTLDLVMGLLKSRKKTNVKFFLKKKPMPT